MRHAIWIIDEDPHSHAVLVPALRHAQLPSRSFNHPRQALEELRALRALRALPCATAAPGPVDVSLVLCAVQSAFNEAELDGLDLFSACCPDLAVIALVADSARQRAGALAPRAAYAYVPKPLDLALTLTLIRRALAEVPQNAAAVAAVAAVAAAAHSSWEQGLQAEATALLGSGQTELWAALAERFEARLICAALAHSKGRRVEAAQQLGIGRNTITRKIQALGLA